MESQVVAQLLRLNRDFYERFGDAFAQTRGPQQPGLQKLAAYLPNTGALLDVGCGNGRLAHVLDLVAAAVTYVGLDASERLLASAQAQAGSLRHVHAEFLRVDVTEAGWEQVLPLRRFEGMALLAVLHHLPGDHLRRNLLHTLRALAAGDAVLIVSTWQFMASERLRRKIVPWSAVGLTPDQVDPGDYLLDWKRAGYGLRYCRLIDQAELSALAHQTGWRVQTMFNADGAQDDLNLCAVLRSHA